MQPGSSEHIGITYRRKQHITTVDKINKINRVFGFDAQTGVDPEGGQRAMAPQKEMFLIKNNSIKKTFT